MKLRVESNTMLPHPGQLSDVETAMRKKAAVKAEKEKKAHEEHAKLLSKAGMFSMHDMRHGTQLN